jgi:hypothetical protein
VVYSPTTLPSGAVCLFAKRVTQRQAANFDLEAGALLPFMTGAMEMREVQGALERGERLVDLHGDEIAPHDEAAFLAVHALQRLEQGAPQHRPHAHRINPPRAPQTYRVRR